MHLIAFFNAFVDRMTESSCLINPSCGFLQLLQLPGASQFAYQQISEAFTEQLDLF